jgi:hypothetical protein
MSIRVPSFPTGTGELSRYGREGIAYIGTLPNRMHKKRFPGA